MILTNSGKHPLVLTVVSDQRIVPFYGFLKAGQSRSLTPPAPCDPNTESIIFGVLAVEDRAATRGLGCFSTLTTEDIDKAGLFTDNLIDARSRVTHWIMEVAKDTGLTFLRGSIVPFPPGSAQYERSKKFPAAARDVQADTRTIAADEAMLHGDYVMVLREDKGLGLEDDWEVVGT